jgi:hypothetical protein
MNLRSLFFPITLSVLATTSHAFVDDFTCSIQNEQIAVLEQGTISRGGFSVYSQGTLILTKRLPLKKDLYQDKTVSCLVNGNFVYVIQQINTQADALASRNLIYFHKIDFKGRIISSISPFSEFKSCQNGNLKLINNSNLSVSASCAMDKLASEVKQSKNYDLTLKPLVKITDVSQINKLDINKPIKITGRVIGPLTMGDKSEGNEFTAYYLKLNTVTSIDDRRDCGKQETNQLAIEKIGMQEYLNKNITIIGQVYCHIERTGQYHLNQITSIRSVK